MAAPGIVTQNCEWKKNGSTVRRIVRVLQHTELWSFNEYKFRSQKQHFYNILGMTSIKIQSQLSTVSQMSVHRYDDKKRLDVLLTPFHSNLSDDKIDPKEAFLTTRKSWKNVLNVCTSSGRLFYKYLYNLPKLSPLFLMIVYPHPFKLSQLLFRWLPTPTHWTRHNNLSNHPNNQFSFLQFRLYSLFLPQTPDI